MGMGNLQRMAQQMQQEMLRVQAELDSVKVDGSAGGGAYGKVVSLASNLKQNARLTLRASEDTLDPSPSQ